MKVIVMKPEASVSEIGSVIGRLERLGFKPLPYRSDDKTTIGVLGFGRSDELSVLEAMPGVEGIISIDKPYKLGNREFKPEGTVVRANGVAIGGDRFVVMAGPCTVESFDQVLSTAEAVKAAGARILRGGAFKPRTSPYSFQGLGEEGLKILLAVKRRTGLPIVTEVTSPHLVDLVCRYADILQIGARNMQNYALLKAVGDVRKPVLLKRGMMSTIDELLMAAEYILANGNTQVILCERGIRTFEISTRNTLDISAIPVIKSRSHLPIIVDPSHATGERDLIKPVSMAALAAGADGILVEVHPSPENALCDGVQSLSFPEFEEMMLGLRAVADAVGRPIAKNPQLINDVKSRSSERRERPEGAGIATGGEGAKNAALFCCAEKEDAGFKAHDDGREEDAGSKACEPNEPAALPATFVSIIGLGQIGGSLASALKAEYAACRITGYDKNRELLDEAAKRGIIDFAARSLEQALAKAGVAFLAVPSLEITGMLPIASRLMPPGSVLIDVGSTKRSIVAEMEKTGGGIHCLGGHPITGSELTGPRSWNAGLFTGRRFVLVRTRSTTPGVEKTICEIFSRIGARVMFMDAEAHDRALAVTSHLPHLLACALTALVDRKGPGIAPLTGGAFRSATRVVASSPEMRTDIYLTNRDMIIQAYNEFDKEVRSLLSIAAGEGEKLKAVLEKLRNVHERITTGNGSNRPKNEITPGNTESSRR